MKDTPPHLQALEEVERAGIPGLLEVLREENLDDVRYTLWGVTGWRRDYWPPWGTHATEEQKRVGWEMAVSIEKIIVAVLRSPRAAGRGGHERLLREAERVLQVGIFLSAATPFLTAAERI